MFKIKQQAKANTLLDAKLFTELQKKDEKSESKAQTTVVPCLLKNNSSSIRPASSKRRQVLPKKKIEEVLPSTINEPIDRPSTSNVRNHQRKKLLNRKPLQGTEKSMSKSNSMTGVAQNQNTLYFESKSNQLSSIDPQEASNAIRCALQKLHQQHITKGTVISSDDWQKVEARIQSKTSVLLLKLYHKTKKGEDYSHESNQDPEFVPQLGSNLTQLEEIVRLEVSKLLEKQSGLIKVQQRCCAFESIIESMISQRLEKLTALVGQ